MIKNKYDTRVCKEIVGDLVSARTVPGDSIKMIFKYNGEAKPSVWLEFHTYDPDKKALPSLEEITDWVDDKPYYDIIDDSTGKPIEGDSRRGSHDWREFMDNRFGPMVQSIVKSGGRLFSYEVKP